jgi:hypothetical protein
VCLLLLLLLLLCNALQQQHSHDHGCCSGHHHAEHGHTAATAAAAAATANGNYSTHQYYAHTTRSSTSSSATAAADDDQQFQQGNDELQVDEAAELQEDELDVESDVALAVRLGMTADADLGSFNLKVVSQLEVDSATSCSFACSYRRLVRRSCCSLHSWLHA